MIVLIDIMLCLGSAAFAYKRHRREDHLVRNFFCVLTVVFFIVTMLDIASMMQVSD